jgi:hypothetical protein
VRPKCGQRSPMAEPAWWADECQADLDGGSFVPKPRSRLPERSFDGLAGLFDCEPPAVNN